MEGGEKLGDDNSDMDMVDATLQNQQHSDTKDQNADAGSVPHNSPTQLQQDQVMVDQGQGDDAPTQVMVKIHLHPALLLILYMLIGHNLVVAF